MTSEQRLAETLGIPYSIQQVQIGKYSINYLVAGSGPPLLLIHGANIGWGMWYANIKELSNFFSIFAIDLPGAGGSTILDFHRANLYEDFVDVVDKFIQEKRLSPISVIGHSFVGWIALQLAHKKHIKIEKLILISSLGFSTYLPLKQRLATLYPLAVFLTKTALKPTKENMKKFLLEVFYDKICVSEDFINYFCEARQRSPLTHPLLFINSISSRGKLRKELDVQNILAFISQPILSIYGNQDDLFRREEVAPNVYKLPHVTMEFFEKCGHVPSIEHDQFFNKLAIDFLSK